MINKSLARGFIWYDKTMNKQNGNTFSIAIAILLAVIILGALGYVYCQNFTINKKQKDQTNVASTSEIKPSAENQVKNLSNDQIFNEVASQFNVSRDQLIYFRIFGKDKVQYNTGGGATFAYKDSDSWKIAQRDAHSVGMCSDLSQVPEKYRPICYDTTDKSLYVDANSQSTNYPPSSMVSYIGQ